MSHFENCRGIVRGSGLLIAVGLFCLTPHPAAAVDGVIEMNQAQAVAGGVTPGDGPLFPITIDRAGSYRLTGNLEVDQNTTAIEITAASGSVHIDLNGFEIRGVTNCGGDPLVCSPTGSGRGIFSDHGAYVIIRNGRIRGMGGFGVFILGQGCLIEDVSVRESAEDGLHLDIFATVRRCSATANGQSGILADAFTTIVDSAVSANGANGITSGFGTRVVDSRAHDNAGAGLALGPSAVVLDVSASGNGRTGIEIGSDSTVRGSTATSNKRHGILAGDENGLFDGVELSGNVTSDNGEGGTGDGILTGNDAIVSDCTSSGNEVSGIAMGANSLLIGNHAAANQYGVTLASGTGYVDNVFVDNTVSNLNGTGIPLGTNLCSGAPCP